MAALSIHIRSKTYPTANRPIITDFSLTVAYGEFVCLVGPSGCGKTTLLNILAGLDTDYDGDIVAAQGQVPKIGYVFQNPRLLPWRTVRENIALVLDNNHTADLVDSLLEAMHLTDVQHVYPERLSLGMSRRVAICRAFAANPQLLLMDEPFVSLDAPTSRYVRSLLEQLWQQRPHSVLFVTHDLREAIALADRLVFLSAAPMTVIRSAQIPIARDQRHDEAVIELFRQQLKQRYPDLQASF